MQSEIRQYLRDGYFAQGVALLRRCDVVAPGVLRHYEQYLSRPYVPSGVEADLQGLLRGFLVEESPVKPPDPLKGEPTEGRASEPTRDDAGTTNLGGFWAGLAQRRELPDEIMALRDRAIELHKRESLVHGQMGVAARAGKQKVAYELAREIMEEIRPELDGIYDAVRAWEATGKLTVKQMAADSPEKTVLEQMKRLKYCNERVSRINRWLTDGYREKTVKGEKAKVLLDVKDVQELDGERLGLLVEAKEIKEKLGI